MFYSLNGGFVNIYKGIFANPGILWIVTKVDTIQLKLLHLAGTNPK